MKNNLKKILFIILILIPFTVRAESEYGIENFFVNATVEESGDLTVEEYFYMNGDYNGFERTYNYANSDAYEFDPDSTSYGPSSIYNGENIVIESVKGLPINEDFDFSNTSGDEFEQTSDADKGDYQKYIFNSLNNGVSVKMFNPKSKHKAFYVKYKIKNIAVLHNDVGELYWQAFDTLSESIKNLTITVNFPNNKNLRVWAHGPLNGEVWPKDNNKLVATINNVSARTKISVRATFDKELISLSNKKTNINALDKILLYEESAAEQANYEREQSIKKAKSDLMSQLNIISSNPSRYNYNLGLDYLSKIPKNDEDYESLSTKLYALEDLVIKKEEQDAYDALVLAEETPTYYWYDNALDKISILTNTDLKKEYIKRLNIVKEKIITKETKKVNIVNNISIFSCIIIVVMVIIIYFKYDKEYKPVFKEKYLRDFPEDETPTNVSYLLYKKIKTNAISAELLNMIYKGNIKAEKIDGKKEDYELTFINKENLTEKEIAIVRLVFFSIDVNSKIKLSDLKKKAKSSYSSFLSRYDRVMTLSENYAKQKEYYESDNVQKKEKLFKKDFPLWIIFIISMIFPVLAIILIPILVLIIVIKYLIVKIKQKDIKSLAITLFILLSIISSIAIFIVFIINYFVEPNVKYYLILLILVIISICYINNTKKYSRTGIEEYSMWKARRNFLNDFSNMKDKTIPEITLWERYLVFATLFGNAKKIVEEMKIAIPEYNGINDTDFTYYMSYNLSNSLDNCIHAAHSVAASAAAAAEAASSSSGGGSWSSGSGGGGGFSSGGGGGGGSGGGRF